MTDTLRLRGPAFGRPKATNCNCASYPQEPVCDPARRRSVSQSISHSIDEALWCFRRTSRTIFRPTRGYLPSIFSQILLSSHECPGLGKRGGGTGGAGSPGGVTQADDAGGGAPAVDHQERQRHRRLPAGQGRGDGDPRRADQDPQWPLPIAVHGLAQVSEWKGNRSTCRTDREQHLVLEKAHASCSDGDVENG